MGDDDTKSFEPTDKPSGELVYAGTGEQKFMVATMTVRNNCSKNSEVFGRSVDTTSREGTKTVSPGQALQIKDWILSGTQSIYLWANGNPGDEPCTVEGLNVYYTDDTPGTY